MARGREALLVIFAALALAVVMTWPLATGLGRLGRVDSGDGQFSLWNVAWVARTLVVDPLHVYDANIYYPHRDTLAYSEANLGAGAIAVPIYWLTRNPYAAHNVVFLLALAASFVCTYLLARELTGSRAAALVAAPLFAFCPYVFAHTPHIQLQMTFGLPLSLLALHRLVAEPRAARGIALGAVLAIQGLFCAYYGVFAGLTVGYGVLFYAAARGRWRSPAYWRTVALAAAVAILAVLPFFLPYLRMQELTGFTRTLQDARTWSANVPAYFASGAHAHRWALPLLLRWRRWSEVLFPGVMVTLLGIAGLPLAVRSPNVMERQHAQFYTSLGLLAGWASFGPAAGLYTVLFRTIPVFSLLRAPSRMAIVVVLSLAMLGAMALRRGLSPLAPRTRKAVAAMGVLLAIADLNGLPIDWHPALHVPETYALLAAAPRGAVAEFPFYGERIEFYQHARYMLLSTSHWQPLVNGYSDSIPGDFRRIAPVLATFPSHDSFAVLKQRRVRYIVLHRDLYRTEIRSIERRLDPFRSDLRLMGRDPDIDLYEIVAWPK
ncbi:MAG TPA: hypothetical protein VFX12_12690 [Vicinamibacterales bacterium]|nr:hypothetical protein [Vicinamibacterales bacterium]